MKKQKVYPQFVTVGNKQYQIKTVSAPQKDGTGDWVGGVSQSLDTYRGERIAVLKPL